MWSRGSNAAISFMHEVEETLKVLKQMNIKKHFLMEILNIIIAIIASRESLQNSVLNANQVLPKINIANDHSSPQS